MLDENKVMKEALVFSQLVYDYLQARMSPGRFTEKIVDALNSDDFNELNAYIVVKRTEFKKYIKEKMSSPYGSIVYCDTDRVKVVD